MSRSEPASTPPERYCDLVMKGGITSGVVYPLAVAELASIYRFKNIGGTSAGAIAAALVAAAEYRRVTTDTGTGFDQLARLPNWLGASHERGSNLSALFQPEDRTRKLFALLFTGVRYRGARRLLAVTLTGAANFPLAVLLGVLPAGLTALALLQEPPPAPLLLLLLVLLSLLALVGGALAIGASLAWRALSAIPANLFGLCTGNVVDARARLPLTPWLEQLIDEVAFAAPPSSPLTFGDLWSAGNPTAERGINLEMMTTNLSQGRPERVPRAAREYWFSPKELQKLFSQRVVDHLIQHARKPQDENLAAAAEQEGLVPLPLPEDLPVVVAARLSLSFPLLLSAVPLWAFDFTYRPSRVRRCWFSDGGITSNLPVHFFDQLIPRWPTFAFNLSEFHPQHPYDPQDECNNIWLPADNRGGIAPHWSSLDETRGASRLGAFVGAIIDTMQNWRDNLQMRVPGFRDRIAHIKLRAIEGGMNLTMPPGQVAALSKRGQCAAQELLRRYDSTPPPGTVLTWDNHCWVRLRTALHLLQQKLGGLQRAYQTRQGAHSYDDLLRRQPPSYPFTDQRAADQLLNDLAKLLEAWQKYPDGLNRNAPKPTPDLRITPTF